MSRCIFDSDVSISRTWVQHRGSLHFGGTLVPSLTLQCSQGFFDLSADDLNIVFIGINGLF